MTVLLFYKYERLKVNILSILLNSTEDCNSMYFAKSNKVFNVNNVVNVLF